MRAVAAAQRAAILEVVDAEHEVADVASDLDDRDRRAPRIQSPAGVARHEVVHRARLEGRVGRCIGVVEVDGHESSCLLLWTAAIVSTTAGMGRGEH